MMLRTLGANWMVVASEAVFAVVIASRRLIWPGTCASVELFTTIVDGTQRTSRASRSGRNRCGAVRIVRATGRLDALRTRERIVMANSGSRMANRPPRGRNEGTG